MREIRTSGVSGGGRVNGLGSCSQSTAAPPDPRAHVPCKPLRKEEVPAGPVDRRYGGVSLMPRSA